MSYTLDIRPKRQVTLPKGLLQSLGLEVGDSIEIKVKGKSAQLKSKKRIAMDALKQLRELFKESGVTLKEMQENAVRIRTEMNEKRNS